MSNNPNANDGATVQVGAAWTAGSQFSTDAYPPAPYDPDDETPDVNTSGLPAREIIVPGDNSPLITGIGWRREINRMLRAKGLR